MFINLIISILIFIIVSSLFYLFIKYSFGNRNYSINTWMKMTRAKRDSIYNQDNIRVKQRKKTLINQIRNEYNRIKK